MKKFNIKIISKTAEQVDDLPCYWGKIVLGKYKNEFVLSVDSWSLLDYKKQWKNGLERIKTQDASCIVTDIRNIKKRPSMEFWALYKVGTTIFIMSKVRGGKKVFKEIEKGAPPYYFDTCYEFVPPRVTNSKGNAIDDDGYELIEHVVDIQDVNDFLASYKEK